MLDTGDIGQEFDGAQLGRLGHGVLEVFVPGQIGFDKDHLPAQVPGQSLGFDALFFVDVQPHGHEAVGGGGDGRSPADSPAGPGHQADVVDVKIRIGQDQHIVFPDFGLGDIDFFAHKKRSLKGFGFWNY